MKTWKKSDFYFIGIVLTLTLVAFLFFQFSHGKKGDMVMVYQNGKNINMLPLSANVSIIIRTTGGGINKLTVQDGKAAVTEANCPDKICVHQRSIDKDGESIVCLPHKLVIKVVSEKKSEFDAITN